MNKRKRVNGTFYELGRLLKGKRRNRFGHCRFCTQLMQFLDTHWKLFEFWTEMPEQVGRVTPISRPLEILPAIVAK